MLVISFCAIACLSFSFRLGKYHLQSKSQTRYAYHIENIQSLDESGMQKQSVFVVKGNTTVIPSDHPVIKSVLQRFNNYFKWDKYLLIS